MQQIKKNILNNKHPLIKKTNVHLYSLQIFTLKKEEKK